MRLNTRGTTSAAYFASGLRKNYYRAVNGPRELTPAKHIDESPLAPIARSAPAMMRFAFIGVLFDARVDRYSGSGGSILLMFSEET